MMQKHPNSYTYSKRLAEALVRESYPELPATVVRPSIGEFNSVIFWDSVVDEMGGPARPITYLMITDYYRRPWTPESPEESKMRLRPFKKEVLKGRKRELFSEVILL